MAPEQKAGIVAFLHAGNTLAPDLWQFAEKALSKLTNSKIIKSNPGTQDLASYQGKYSLTSYDSSYIEAAPKFYNYEINLDYDDNEKKLFWIDEDGPAPMQSIGGEFFEVQYEDTEYNFKVRIAKAKDVVAIISRDFAGLRI